MLPVARVVPERGDHPSANSILLGLLAASADTPPIANSVESSQHAVALQILAIRETPATHRRRPQELVSFPIAAVGNGQGIASVPERGQGATSAVDNIRYNRNHAPTPFVTTVTMAIVRLIQIIVLLPLMGVFLLVALNRLDRSAAKAIIRLSPPFAPPASQTKDRPYSGVKRLIAGCIALYLFGVLASLVLQIAR